MGGAWGSDPWKRYVYRWYTDLGWTEYVSDGARQYVDSPGERTAPVAPVAPAAPATPAAPAGPVAAAAPPSPAPRPIDPPAPTSTPAPPASAPTIPLPAVDATPVAAPSPLRTDVTSVTAVTVEAPRDDSSADLSAALGASRISSPDSAPAAEITGTEITGITATVAPATVTPELRAPATTPTATTPTATTPTTGTASTAPAARATATGPSPRDERMRWVWIGAGMVASFVLGAVLFGGGGGDGDAAAVDVPVATTAATIPETVPTTVPLTVAPTMPPTLPPTTTSTTISVDPEQVARNDRQIDDVEWFVLTANFRDQFGFDIPTRDVATTLGAQACDAATAATTSAEFDAALRPLIDQSGLSFTRATVAMGAFGGVMCVDEFVKFLPPPAG